MGPGQLGKSQDVMDTLGFDDGRPRDVVVLGPNLSLRHQGLLRIVIVVIPNRRRKFRPGLARRVHPVLMHPNPEAENIVGAGAVETTQERLRPICDIPGPRSRSHLLNH